MNLSDALTSGEVLHLRAAVTHARRGKLRHSFRYATDYLLLSPQHSVGPALFSRNRFNLMSVRDRDHGGVRGAGQGVAWARARFEEAGFSCGPGVTLALLTQPRVMGHWFTPISFWLALEGESVRAAIAEVNNTFGQRHSYLCCKPGFGPIEPKDAITAEKVFHVSPFQDVAGDYRFNFSITSRKIAIRILYRNGENGLDAFMSGDVVPLTSLGVLKACLARPIGSLRVLFLIYWNAVKLKLKGARYRALPPVPEQDVSR